MKSDNPTHLPDAQAEDTAQPILHMQSSGEQNATNSTPAGASTFFNAPSKSTPKPTKASIRLLTGMELQAFKNAIAGSALKKADLIVSLKKQYVASLELCSQGLH